MRTEVDMLGALEVPEDVLWGIHTARAVRNFTAAGRPVRAAWIRALAQVKKACCLANLDLGCVPAEIGRAIVAACDEVAGGQFADQFPVDALQGGAGTSTHMNMNEVLANRAAQRMGGRLGTYDPVHPLHHVNLHQSTNDVMPTALRVAAIRGLRALSAALAALQGACQARERDFATVVTIGRTELTDAVPMTLGAIFAGFAEAFGRDRWRTFKCEERLRTVNLGGTSVGTGLGAPREYIFLATDKLREETGLGLARGEHLVDLTSNADPFVEVAGVLDACGTNLRKIANDLRLLRLAGEVDLPAVQAGSSAMPGKVNPVLPEAVIQASLRAMAAARTVADCAAGGTLQINEFLPLLGDALLEQQELLVAGARMLQACMDAVCACPGTCARRVADSPALFTAFVPELGYEAVRRLREEFLAADGRDVRGFLASKLGVDRVDRILCAESLTALGHVKP